jgi:hypothetical protein
VVTKSEEYRLKARECEERADRTRGSFIKQQLIDLASTGAPWPTFKRSTHAKAPDWTPRAGRTLGWTLLASGSAD